MLGALPFGWLAFLKRILPQITMNWDLIGMAIICLAGFLGGSHWFLRWLYGARRNAKSEATVDGDGPVEEASSSPEWKLVWTASINGLLWLCFFIGMSFLGVVHQVGWVAASDEPRVVVKFGGNSPRNLASTIAMYFDEVKLPHGAEYEEYMQTARDTYRERTRNSGARAFLLVDSEGVVRGAIAFYASSSGIYGGRIGVLDIRAEQQLAELEREELARLMKRYQAELHPFL